MQRKAGRGSNRVLKLNIIVPRPGSNRVICFNYIL